MEIFVKLSKEWFFIALLAPFLWSLVNMIDLYFVESIYENEYDGTVFTGFAQIILWLTVPFFGLVVPDWRTIILAMLGGFSLVTAYFFYFKVLFVTGDATQMQILWNAVAISVPILAFIFLGEKLTLIQYFGIVITFFGAMYVAFNNKIKRKNSGKIVLITLGVILFWSLYMIFSREVYSRTSFHGGIMFFSLGSILAGAFFYLLRIKKHGTGKLIAVGKKYFLWFFLVEGLTLMGVITSQRAIDLSPAVSLVAVVESIQPVFIILVSAIIFAVFSLFSRRNKEIAKKIYDEQLVGIGSKIYAIIIMAVGIYMINL
jgi:drug/metabolite transporter (DMT)-like permease